VPIVEALEIDLVEIHPRAEVLEYFRGAISIRHVRRRQPRQPRFLEDRDRPLARNQRLVVGAHHHARPETKRIPDERARRRLHRRHDRGWIPDRLRCDPVLAVRAVQIAAEHAEAVGERAWKGVEERLLLDGIALHPADVAVGHAQPAPFVEADLADPDRTFRQRTTMTARVAAQTAVGEPVVELTLARRVREELGQGDHELIVPTGGKAWISGVRMDEALP
jgi:hypothetical protein